MFDLGKKATLNKKTYEVVYAIFRVAAIMGEPCISESLKDIAIEISEGILAEEYAATEKPFAILEYLVKLAADLNIMSVANGEILSREMTGLKLLVAECLQAQNETIDVTSFFADTHVEKGEREMPHDVSSRSFFSEEGIAISRAEEYQTRAVREDKDFSQMDFRQDASAVTVEAPARTEGERSGNNPSGGFLKSGMRQIAILDKIRQSGNCRMRDIQEVLPDASERTIRYDLEALIERKLIERTGNGGPSVSYRMRQN